MTTTGGLQGGEERDESVEAAACHHMEGLVAGLAADRLHGPANVYTRFHVRVCPRCAAALKGLQAADAEARRLADSADVSQ